MSSSASCARRRSPRVRRSATVRTDSRRSCARRCSRSSRAIDSRRSSASASRWALDAVLEIALASYRRPLHTRLSSVATISKREWIMATKSRAHDATIAWLLDSDPAIRWQVMRDLTDAPAAQVAAERARVATEGWGAQMLARQRPDGRWGEGEPARLWQSTLFALILLRNLGIDPASERAQALVQRVREHVTWGPWHGDSPFFEGESEPCINGHTLAIGAYFGDPPDRLLHPFLLDQLADRR